MAQLKNIFRVHEMQDDDDCQTRTLLIIVDILLVVVRIDLSQLLRIVHFNTRIIVNGWRKRHK